MKYLFRGDPEFNAQNYAELPYNYVLEAYEQGFKQMMKMLHMEEAPIALQTSILANTHRDPKKKKEGYKMDDFFVYQTKEEMNIPTSRFGAAALELVRRNLLPRWALFVYKDLSAAAEGAPPSVLAYQAEDVIILAPLLAAGDVRGMIICLESSYGEERTLTSKDGQSIKIMIPRYKGKVYADDEFRARLL